MSVNRKIIDFSNQNRVQNSIFDNECSNFSILLNVYVETILRLENNTL